MGAQETNEEEGERVDGKVSASLPAFSHSS